VDLQFQRLDGYLISPSKASSVVSSEYAFSVNSVVFRFLSFGFAMSRRAPCRGAIHVAARSVKLDTPVGFLWICFR